MGDGGVACVPLQHVMAAIPETFCGGGGGSGKPLKLKDSNSKMELVAEKVEVENGGEFERREVEKGEIVADELTSGKDGRNGGENSSLAQPKKKKKLQQQQTKRVVSKDGVKTRVISTVVKMRKEVNRGNTSSTTKGKKGEVAVKPRGQQAEKSVVEKPQKLRDADKSQKGGDVEREDKQKNVGGADKFGSVAEKWSRVEIEKGEIVPERWEFSGSGRLRKGEFLPDKWRRERKEQVERGEFVPDRWRNGEADDKEDSVLLERWRKGVEAVKEEFVTSSGKGQKRELEKGEFVPEKVWKDDLERSPKKDLRLSDEDFSQRRDYTSRGCGDRRKRSSCRLEASEDRDSKSSSSSRVADAGELLSSSCKHDYGEGKNHVKDYASSGTWLRPDYMLSESTIRKNYGEVSEYSASKSRRVSDDHTGYSDKLLSRSGSVERHRTLLSKVSLANRYVSRRYEPLSRGGADRLRRSPCQHERSPHDRSRYLDHRDRSPARSSYSERSPHERARHHDHRERTPGRMSYLDRSPHDRKHHRDHRGDRSPARHRDHRDRTPARSERSPRERARYRDHKERSPSHSDRSPLDRGRHHDYKDLSPVSLEKSPNDHGRPHSFSLEKSPHDHGRPHSYREAAKRKGGVNERQSSQSASQGHEENTMQESSKRDFHKHSTGKQWQDSSEKNVDYQSSKENSQEPTAECNEFPSEVIETHEEFQSMEEDMDICDTPPHVPLVSDSSLGKWFYLDHFGVEQGPSKLSDLRRLVEEGVLQSDHLIKHFETDRWLTVENASSPVVPFNPPSIVSDVVTKLVNPPEAPGNVLVDVNDTGLPTGTSLDVDSVELEYLEDFNIEERVRAIMKDHTVIPGRELEAIADALQMVFDSAEWERWSASEGLLRSGAFVESSKHPRDEDFGRGLSSIYKEYIEARPVASSEEFSFINSECNDWFSSLWSCKGGDWKRNDEVAHDRCFKRKIVLNEGYPLCQMPKSGYEDPRWPRKDDLYYPSQNRRLDLPNWAFTLMDEKNDVNSDVNKSVASSRSMQLKSSVLRGVKGIMLPVVRINACVVKDHGSFFSEPRFKARTHSSRSIRSLSTCVNDGHRSSSIEAISQSKKDHDSDSQALHKCITVINTPKDHVCKIDELQLELGDWYYLDGAGHECGPLSFSELQSLVAQGIIPKHSSVFRKFDNIWVPITTALASSETVHTQIEKVATTSSSSSTSSTAFLPMQVALVVMDLAQSSFHNSHPQFIGYTRGKLHELVMKSYRSREFAAAINEVLDPWITAKQPKKEMDKYFPFNSSITNGSADFANDMTQPKVKKSDGSLSRFSGEYSRFGKRARLMVEDTDEDDDMEEDFVTDHQDFDFDNLCGETSSAQMEYESWGLLSNNILARVFHFLRFDLRSLAFSAATCKCWNTAVKFYREISRQVDLSTLGSNCTDPLFRKILSGYNKRKITSIVLSGCTNVSADALEEVLHLFPSVSFINIRGCCQFRELRSAFKNVKWIGPKSFEEVQSKMKSLKVINEKSFLNSKALRGLAPDGVGGSFDHGSYLDRKDSAGYAFRQSYYKRTKLLHSRKSSAALSRDAHMRRRWLCRKSESGYKRVEQFLAATLKDILKENRSEFFIPKVAEIEDRMRNGYYVAHGLGSVKEDISRMCRDAIKAKSRGDARDINHIIMLFIRLIKSLEEDPKSSDDRDDAVKLLKDSSISGLSSVALKYKKKNINALNERRIRSNGTSYGSGGMDYGEYASDREIRRRLSKLNKRSFDSESETSDDYDFFEDGRVDVDDTTSDTESDLDIHSEGRHGDLRDMIPLVSADESLDSMVEDREWGARMTKASLVPPVTRKYEVIDHYVIVADEKEVQRKMRVALPDDYAERLSAQNNCTESDLDIPEVKYYKPRKRLGDEVLEQEVYGIDPYTHNLLLDSMPEEPEWPLLDRHQFIEEVLLRALNKQVRHFTGGGSTPMMYPLRPVVEEIHKIAEEEKDTRIVKMCQVLLKAMHSRPEDNYVAYRKGLGVVCNKVNGFEEDDFVVEFLGEVYPAWKWFEKQDGIRSLQKNNKDPAPEFYNIYLERPKGDRDGYDLVVVDAMHKANYASRICHSCHPNCEAKVTAVDGQYQIGIYSLRKIEYGEEITFDYNSVTESKEEYEASVCLCGSQVCRGSYLNLTGEGAFQKVLKECHGILDRHQLMLEACEVNCVSHEDCIDLSRAGLGTCLLDGLPDWLIAYSARLVRFINFERTKLPEEILKHNLDEKRKFFSDSEICLENEKADAEVQAEGVYNQRLQNLALTLDKVRYVMRCVFGDARKAPPPLQKLNAEALVCILWKGEGSLVHELLQCMAPYMESDLLNELKLKIVAHDPSGSDDLQRELQRSLLWLRDEIRNLPCSYKCRHDAAADLIHIYAHTKCFFRVRDYKSVTSPPVYISPLDLGPMYADKLGSGLQEFCKTYGENYCLGQLIYWHIQTNAEPDRSLARARRGCLSLPDISSFYAKSQKSSRKHVYGPRTLKFMLAKMEKQPQRPWPKDRIWTFSSAPRVFGSPMLDAVLNKSPLDRDMLQWLRTRPFLF